MEYIPSYRDSLYLEHHGILGQKWGKRNGPPYPLGGGSYSKSEEKAIKAERKKKYSRYNKKHYDQVLKEGTTFKTLSFDKDRTKNTNMFFASHTKADIDHYKEFFDKPIPKDVYDKDGKKIGTEKFYKYSIQNKAAKDMKIASEDSGARVFTNLYAKDRDFANFVQDPTRLRARFEDGVHKISPGYAKARKAMDRLAKGDDISSNDLKSIYRIFNHAIPSDGGGDARAAKDVATQRAKFFKACKEAGYSGILDTNDALYNTVQAQSPVIMFDMANIIPAGAYQTTAREVTRSKFYTAGRRALGMM